MSNSDKLKIYPCEHGLEALDENMVTDAQIELDVELPDGSKLYGLRATMGQRNQSNDIYLIIPAAPLSAFVDDGQQSLPFSFAWANGKKPGVGDRSGGEPRKIVMTFQQQELDGKATTPELAKATVAQLAQQQQVRKPGNPGLHSGALRLHATAG